MENAVKKAKIMVVEDEAITARDLQLRLQHMGYDVSCSVATGESAIDKAREIGPDLVLMDIMLQGQIDGIEAARQIRLTRDVPIIYLSAYTDKMLSERAKDTDPYAYLSKPFAEYDLRNTLEMVLYKHSMDRKLRKEKEFTENAIDAQIDTFFVFDPKTRKAIRWNKSFREITGYTDEEIASLKAPDSYYSKDDLKKALAVINDIIIGGQGSVEISLICKNGKKIPTEYLASSVKDEDNNVRYIISIGRDIAERKKVEKALYESEKKYHSLILNIPSVTWISDVDGKTSFISSNIEKVYGYTPEEIYDAGEILWFDRVHPEDIEKVKRAYIDMFKKEETFDIEYRIERKDGQWIWIHDKAVTTYEKDAMQYAYGVLTDITERKRSEKELKDSEEKFAKAFQYAATIISISTIDEGRFINVNDAFLKVFGFEREEVIGKSSMELNLFEDPEQRATIKQMIKEKGNVHDYELKVRTKGGSFRWGMVSFDVIQLKGEPYFLSVMNDITELRNAMEELRNTLRTSNDIFQTIPSGLFIYQFEQPDSLFLLNGNPESEILSDIKVKDWIGKGFDEIWPEAEKRGFTREVLEVMRTGKTYVTDDFYYKDTKLEGFFKIHAFRLPCDRLAVAFENITDSKKSEEALKKAKKEVEALNRDLEKRIMEKTKELERSHAQLIQSEKLSAMGQMAGGLAHELNSPLAGLLPMIEKYRNEAVKDSKAYNDLSLMHNACEYMAKIIKDFGVFSSELKGKLNKLNLNEVIEDTLNFSKSKIKQEKVQIYKEFEDELSKVLGEKAEIQQVVLNFITNALDAMPEGGELKIRTSTSKNMDSVIMEFIDNGIGIEKDKLDKIFDPFYTTKRPGKGIGLGLSISYKTMEKYGGKITVDSEPGKGSRFSVYLPAVRSIHKT